jgi:pimeloyl-ACP methyl ester carboxylesterase
MIPEDERVDGGGLDSPTKETESIGGDEDGPASVGSGTVLVDGHHVAYRRAGTEGEPVILLHGAGVDDAALSWAHVLPELGRSHRVFALDWPGYGDSENIGEHTVDAYRDVLTGFLDALDLERVALGGISMGGGVALAFALDAPERVQRLALVSSYGLGSRIPAGSLWYALANVPGANRAGYAAMGSSMTAARVGLDGIVYDASALDESFVAGFRERARKSGAGSAFAAFQRAEIGADGSAATNYAAELADIDVPTLFVHGRHDPLFPVEWARRGAELVADARLVELDACGHWPTHEHPERVTAELVDFFSN